MNNIQSNKNLRSLKRKARKKESKRLKIYLIKTRNIAFSFGLIPKVFIFHSSLIILTSSNNEPFRPIFGKSFSYSEPYSHYPH